MLARLLPMIGDDPQLERERRPRILFAIAKLVRAGVPRAGAHQLARHLRGEQAHRIDRLDQLEAHQRLAQAPVEVVEDGERALELVPRDDSAPHEELAEPILQHVAAHEHRLASDGSTTSL